MKHHKKASKSPKKNIIISFYSAIHDLSLSQSTHSPLAIKKNNQKGKYIYYLGGKAIE